MNNTSTDPIRRKPAARARLPIAIAALALALGATSSAAQQLVRDITVTGDTAAELEIATIIPGDSGSLFAGLDPLYGEEPWFTDGTTVGTVQVADLEPGPSGASPRAMAAFGTGVVFAAATADGDEPWFSDGPLGGTVALERPLARGGRQRAGRARDPGSGPLALLHRRHRSDRQGPVPPGAAPLRRRVRVRESRRLVIRTQRGRPNCASPWPVGPADVARGEGARSRAPEPTSGLTEAPGARRSSTS